MTFPAANTMTGANLKSRMTTRMSAKTAKSTFHHGVVLSDVVCTGGVPSATTSMGEDTME